MRHDSTPPVYLIKLFDVLKDLGHPEGDLAHHIGVFPAELADRVHPVPLSTYVNAVEFAMDNYRVPDLGFLVGEHTSMLEHGVLGYALLSSRNLRESLRRYVRYQYLQGPLLAVNFHEGESVATLTAVPRRGRLHPSPAALRYFIQEWLVGWNQWCQIIARSGHFFAHVRLAYKPVGDNRYYAEHLGCTVSFDNDETTGFFPARWLDIPLEFADEAIAGLCSAQCERMLEILDKQSGLSADIHRLLSRAPGNMATMDKIAKQLHIGVRTLRRRLRDEGTTYQDVVIEYRVAMAKRYLQETRLPANEIAMLVGYSDPANLYRVFRMKAGMTPQDYRLLNQELRRGSDHEQ